MPGRPSSSSAKYGLPTADLDKYLAFLEQRRNQVGEISNPVAFTSTQLLTVLGIKDGGKNFQGHSRMAAADSPDRYPFQWHRVDGARHAWVWDRSMPSTGSSQQAAVGRCRGDNRGTGERATARIHPAEPQEWLFG
jgi:hypothetical protein